MVSPNLKRAALLVPSVCSSWMFNILTLNLILNNFAISNNFYLRLDSIDDIPCTNVLMLELIKRLMIQTFLELPDLRELTEERSLSIFLQLCITNWSYQESLKVKYKMRNLFETKLYGQNLECMTYFKFRSSYLKMLIFQLWYPDMRYPFPTKSYDELFRIEANIYDQKEMKIFQ